MCDFLHEFKIKDHENQVFPIWLGVKFHFLPVKFYGFLHDFETKDPENQVLTM